MKKSATEIIEIIAGLGIKPGEVFRYKGSGEYYQVQNVYWGAGNLKDKVIIGYQRTNETTVSFAKEYSEFLEDFDKDEELSGLLEFS